MIGYWVTLFCVGTVLHGPFRKLYLSDMAMENNKGRTALVFFGTGISTGKSPESWKGDEDCCGRQASVKSFVQRQRGRIWPCGTFVCEGGNIILTASTSKNPPMGTQKLCCSHALLLDAPSSAPGGSSPAVSNARARPKPRGPHLQVWRRGTLKLLVWIQPFTLLQPQWGMSSGAVHSSQNPSLYCHSVWQLWPISSDTGPRTSFVMSVQQI